MSDSVDQYEKRMLFQPWRNIEEVFGEATEAELMQQKQNQLALFPMSIFPKSVGTWAAAGKGLTIVFTRDGTQFIMQYSGIQT